MFCPKCGKQVDDGAKFCPACGEPLSVGKKVENAANDMFNRAEQGIGSAIDDMKDAINNSCNSNNANYNNAYYNNPNNGVGQRVKDDRDLVVFILLSLITCGIYGYFFLYQLARDMNIACEGDGEQTPGLAAFIVLSFITCGIYGWYWYYKIGNRLAANAPRYGLSFQENGTTILVWLIIGNFICGIGQYVAMYFLIKNSNALFKEYNRQKGF